MKRILLLLLFVLPILVSGQRLKIGKQLEKAPGINYMVLTDINGEQYYTPMSTVLGSINTDQSLGTVTLSGNNLIITERNVLTGSITATYTINLAPYMQTLTAVDNGNGTVTLNMTGDPSPELIDICNIVSTHCNTDLTVSPTGLVTFTDNAGNNFSFNLTSPAAGNDLTYNNGLYFDETVTALSYNPTTHALSYVNEAGATNTITLDVAGLTFNAGTNTLTYTAENGVVTNIVLPADVVTTITNTIAGNRIATYTNENGVAVDIDETITTIVNNGDGTYTYTNEAGATATFPAQANTDTRLSLSVVNDSLRVDVVNIVTGATVSTSYIDNVINHPDVLTTLAYNSTTHTLTYTDENGGTTNLPLDVATMTYNATTNTITYTAENGTVTNIALPVETVTTITNTVTGHKIADYTNEQGAVVPINETVIGTVNNPDGSITITKEDGSTFTSVPVAVNGSGSITAVEVSPNVFNLAFKYDCDSVLACIPADIDTIVTDFDIVGNTASITLSSGQVLSATITHPVDSTVLTTANTNIVVTETSPNTWELEFVYNCDSITNCLAPIQMIQTPVIVAGDTIGYETEITGPLGDVAIDTIYFPAAGGSAPKPTLTTVTGGTGLPNTATFDNGIDPPTVFNYIEGARHDLRLTSPIIERGSDSATDPKGAQFLHDGYSHLNGFSDNWVNTTNVWYRPTLSLQNNGDVWFGALNSASASNAPSVFWDYDKTSLSWGFHTAAQLDNLGTFSFLGGVDNSLTGSYNFFGGGLYGSISGNYNTASGGYSSAISGGNYNTIGGGFFSTIQGNYSTVSGGYGNQIYTDWSNIGGGFLNKIYGSFSGVFTGQNNVITAGQYQLIGGGFNNTINSDTYGVIVGGLQNTVNGRYATIAGGNGNVANGWGSVILNGTANTSNSYVSILSGNGCVPFTGQTATSYVNTDVLEELGNAFDAQNNKSNARTVLKNGFTQIKTSPDGLNVSQADVTPVAALEVVSTVRGFIPPRMNAVEVTAWQASFNTTTDVTGLSGAGDEKHSRQGEMIYAYQTLGNDSSQGVTMVAQWNGTAWIFKKLW